MADRIYPSWEQIESQNQPLTLGERSLLEYLDKYLPKDDEWQPSEPLTDYSGWLIFVQPYLNGNRPDIIVFNPFVGGMVIEVKDWKLKNYHWKEEEKGKFRKTKLYVSDSRGSYKIKSPLTQVIHYKEIIIGQLVPLIGERVDKVKAAYGLFKVAVYFHNEYTSNIQEFFKEKVKDYSKFPVFGHDLLHSSVNLKKIVPDITYSKSRNWDREWNYELLFWFRPPYHSIEQGIPLNLRADQIRIAEPTPAHIRVKGVAGSGKTQALAYRAAKLASNNKKVIILSFNITLWHYIRDMVARAPFNFSWKKLTFNHFHGFCRDTLNELGEEWPESPDDSDQDALENFFRTTVPNTVIEAVLENGYRKFDAILIDEGQDYYLEWYSMLNKYFLNSNDEVLLVVDKKHNIYQRDLDWFDKRSKNIELEKFKTDIITLTTTFRLPKRVAKMANEFSVLFDLDQELQVARIADTPQLFYIDHILWLEIEEEDYINWIYRAFKRLKEDGESPSDIVFLFPNHDKGYRASQN